MSRHMQRKNRGAAAVETALGLLVFVSILVWAIHFAEMAYLAPKVHEAAASAMWDTTAELMHRHPTDYSPRQQAISNAGGKAQGQYSGFDGRSSGNKGNVSLVFTGAGQMRVTCSQEQVASTAQNNFEAYPGGEGGMGCYASARFQVINFPKSFLDKGEGQLFKEENYPPELNDLTFCSFGRAKNGNCEGSKIAMLMDDWGLSGASGENADNQLGSTTNKGFHDLVQNVYDQAYPGGQGKAFAQAIVGMAPGGDEGKFWFSYLKGPDSGMSGGDQDPADWVTNVVENSRNAKYKNRTNPDSFLGIKDVIK